jgi:aspartate carbamoyltransferase regulatory subunit
MSNKETMLVQKISDGTVVDHIAAGKALSVLHLLGNPQEKGVTLALVMNATSSKMGRKDILKVEGAELSEEQVQRLALIAPEASVNIIRSFRVVAKRKVEPPKTLRGILSCNNPTCVSVREKDAVPSIFFKASPSPVSYMCKYCSRELTEQEILAQFR